MFSWEYTPTTSLEPNGSSLCPQKLFLYLRHILIVFSHQCLNPASVLLPKGFAARILSTFPFLSCVLHSPPTSVLDLLNIKSFLCLIQHHAIKSDRVKVKLHLCNIKLFLCLNQHHAIKSDGVKVQLHAFLSIALNRAELLNNNSIKMRLYEVQ